MTSIEKVLECLRTDVLSSTEIAEFTGISRQNVNHQLLKLEKVGLAHRGSREALAGGGTQYYWKIGAGDGVKRVKLRNPNSNMMPKIKRSTATWDMIPKTDMTKGYGYVAIR